MRFTAQQEEEIRGYVEASMKCALLNSDFIKAISDQIVLKVQEIFNKKLSVQEQKIDILSLETNEIRRDIQNLKDRNGNDSNYDELKAKMIELQGECDQLRGRMEKQDRYSRRKQVRIFGVTEGKNENTREVAAGVITEKMKLNSDDIRIKKCLRVGKASAETSRAILVRFETEDMKKTVYNSKRALKGSNIVVREDLTKIQLGLLKCCIGKYGAKNVWTQNGNIYAYYDNRKHFIRQRSDVAVSEV